MKRYTLVRRGEKGEKCYICNADSNRYTDNKHPQKATVNLCPKHAKE